MQPRPVADSRVQLTHLMGITDANNAGNVHGGMMMKLCDEAAGARRDQALRQRVVTAGMDRMAFLVPIYVGELVTFCATVNAAWRTSMEVGVHVEAENPADRRDRHTNTAYLTMVALDEAGEPARPAVSASHAGRDAPDARGGAAPRATGWPSARRSSLGARGPPAPHETTPAQRRPADRSGPRSAGRAVLRVGGRLELRRVARDVAAGACHDRTPARAGAGGRCGSPSARYRTGCRRSQRMRGLGWYRP